ncbi:cytochrome P450 [Mycena capillaripes]|nr:cytochrome P450 [Mycena capillaripes]
MIQILPLAIPNSIWAFAIALFLLCTLRCKHDRSKIPLPPGPKQLPLVGNLFDIPSERQWETYLEWSKQFNSDIIHLNAVGTSVIVLSSMDAVKELFERRSSLYPDRCIISYWAICSPKLMDSPPMHMLELMGWDFAIGVMKYGDRWFVVVILEDSYLPDECYKRSHRKLFHEAFNIAAVKQFRPQVLAATHKLLRRMIRDPHDVMEHFRHMAGALIMDVTYGISVRSSDDPYINLAKDAMHGLSVASIPGAFWVDTIPLLKYVPEWVPGARFKRKAREWRQSNTRSAGGSALGTAAISFTSLNLRALDDSTNGAKAAREKLSQGRFGQVIQVTRAA